MTLKPKAIAGICALLIASISLSVYIYFHYEQIEKIGIYTAFPFFLGLEMEEKAAENLPYGRRGKDDIIYWQDGKFTVKKSGDIIGLDMYNQEKILYSLLSGLLEEDVIGDALYAVSIDGCAVVYQNNTCRLFYFDGCYGDLVDPSVTYLDSFDQFTKAEQEAFDKIQSKETGFIKNNGIKTEMGVYGTPRDSDIVFWQNGKFRISKWSRKSNLIVRDREDRPRYLVINVQNYSIQNDTLFVVNEDSYAVVYENNTCKLFVDRAQYGKIGDPSITYVDRFDQFTKAEQEAFIQLLNED